MTPVPNTLTREAAEKAGIPSLKTFFKRVYKKPGRPKKVVVPVPPPKAKRGRPPSSTKRDGIPRSSKSQKVQTQTEEESAPSLPPKSKKTRTNWGKGPEKARLEAAVGDWDEEKGSALDSNGEKRSLAAFAHTVGIPIHTLRHYLCDDKSKRRKIGASVGRKPVVSESDQLFVAEVIARKDRGNEGLTVAELVELICEVNPNLSRSQASLHFQRTLRPHHTHLIKKNTVKAQATTTKRSSINVHQQYRWHCLINDALANLRQKNVGVCNLSGKSFGELMPYFIFGGDETCFMASQDGSLHIVGATGRKKHNKKAHDSRCSITIYRTGSPSGVTGPSIFLLKGERKRKGYTDAFLQKWGAAEGSTIIMTPNAFETTEAWEEMTPFVVKGLRCANKYTKANPQWWMLEIVDGYGAHLASLKAMQDRYDAKIDTLKEEGDSSEVNQAYDKYVAKHDKLSKLESVSIMNSAKEVTGGVVDQWMLVHAGLYAIRHMNDHPEIWTTSFHECNLDPRTRVSFLDWCRKINHHFQAGETFKVESELVIDTYPLLPAWWHGMTPADKKKVMATKDRFEEGYSVDCIEALHKECYIEYKEMQNARVCIQSAKEHPNQLERGVPSTMEAMNALEIPEVVQEAKAAAVKANDNLTHFLLKPPGLKGQELLDHMIMKRLLSSSSIAKGSSSGNSPSRHLNIEINSTNRNNLKEFADRVAGNVIAKRNIMKDAAGEGPAQKLSERKLCALGNIRPHSRVLNNENALGKYKNQLQLAASIAEIKRREKAESDKKKENTAKLVKALAPAALEKYNDKNQDPNKLTKKEICALLLCCFGVKEDPDKNKKPALVTALQEKIRSAPHALALLPAVEEWNSNGSTQNMNFDNEDSECESEILSID